MKGLRAIVKKIYEVYGYFEYILKRASFQKKKKKKIELIGIGHYKANIILKIPL